MPTAMKIAPVGLFLVTLAAVTPAPAATAPAPVPAPAVAPAEPVPPPLSIFVIDPATAKDPFYPKSKRWVPVAPKTNNGAVVVEQPTFPDEFRVGGFSGTADKRLAIINNRTVEKGEKWDATLKSGQRVQVHCLDIKEKSVTLEINGMAKELTLRPNLQ